MSAVAVSAEEELVDLLFLDGAALRSLRDAVAGLALTVAAVPVVVRWHRRQHSGRRAARR